MAVYIKIRKSAADPETCWEVASEKMPCPLCGSISKCTWNSKQVACIGTCGKLSEVKHFNDCGTECHVHPITLVGQEESASVSAAGQQYRLSEPVPEELKRFIECIFEPEDVVLIRPTESYEEEIDGKLKKQTRTIHDPKIAYPRAKDLASDHQFWTKLTDVVEKERANLYFGVSPRFGKHFYDKAFQIRVIRTLWADIDHVLPEAALKKIESAGLPRPTAMVLSGNGTHAYWRLKEPYFINDCPDPVAIEKRFTKPYGCEKGFYIDVINLLSGGKPVFKNDFPLSQRAKKIQQIARGIAFSIGGDHTHDVSRLLRLPGTMNRKCQRNGRKPVPCTLFGNPSPR